MQIGFMVLMFIIGACMGSFLCCQARRFYLKETKKQKLSKRSICPHCKHQLKWYENLPIISWLALRGKCKKCHRAIGGLEIISEVAFAFSFLALSTTISLSTASVLDWAVFAFLILLVLNLGFLAIYDGAYGQLPTLCLTFAAICAIIMVILQQWSVFLIDGFSWELVTLPLLSFILLGGLYLFLYLISKGKWVGDGDWILAGIIGFALISPWLALISLFLSNLFASFLMYPFVRKRQSKKIHFGPFLVVAFVITYTFSSFFLSMI